MFYRIEAARPHLGENASVRLIIRDLDDETMLKMMAADNVDACNLTPAFILETVEVTREFVLGISKSSKGNVTHTSPTKGPNLDAKVAAFLAWPQERVKHALAQLAAFEPDEEPK